MEWAFFARTQWGQYDTALLELEVTWDKTQVGAPLPVTLGERPAVKKPIQTVQDAKDAMKHYIDLIPFDKILALPQAISTDIHYRSVTDEEMEAALRKRNAAGPAEQDIYASYLLELYLTEMETRHPHAVLQFSIGAEPLPYESGSKLRTETVFEVAEIVSRHPNLNFQFFLASMHQNQAFCTLCRELPNLYLIGYWWHNFFPPYIARVMEERLDMLPLNKNIGFFTDAYCVDWVYAKTLMIRKMMAEVLAKKVNLGQYTKEQAVRIAADLLYGNAHRALGMQ